MIDFTKILAKAYSSETVERLVRYAKIETTSDRTSKTIPSSKGQCNLARLLETELKELGIKDVYVDEHCFVIAHIPASTGYENSPTIGLMAHLDTSSDVGAVNVKPKIITNYDGKDIKLSEGWVLSPKTFEELKNYVGDTLVVTDGTTLLGADDKSGIAIIMTTVKLLLANKKLVHGPLYIIFSPDEEIGTGMDAFPYDKIKMDACYTFDGGRGGEIEAECFTAYTASIDFTGRASHPGYARGVMANAVAMAGSFISMLPRSQSPEATDGWFGYYYALTVQGSLESAHVDVLLRDFTDEGMEARKTAIKSFAKAVEAQFPNGSVKVKFTKQYLNMRKKLDEHPEVLEKLFTAAEKAGANPYSKPIRGGTDGARLTEMGIPTPNIFAGMHNFHSRYEWASASEMTLAVDTTLELVKLWTKGK